MKKYLITGSDGLVGSSLKKLLGDGHIYHTRKDAELTDRTQTLDYINYHVKHNGVDTIINCAAKVGGVQANMKNNKGFFIENFLLNCSFFFLKKNLLIFSLFTLVIFYLEFVSFYLLVSNIFLIKNIFSILLIFFIIFYLNKVPFFINIIGLNEIIVGLFVEYLDFEFVQGSLIQLTYRIFLYMSTIFSSILYYLINFKKSS